MKIAERYKLVLDYLSQQIPEAETELHFTTPFELLVAVVLSAQCTDQRVNKVSPALFRAYPTPEAMARASQDDIRELISSISYPNSKAKYLSGASKLLVENYNGQIPLTVAELIKLPGVGRKTANVITSVLDQQPNMAVDTHVYRLAHRLKLVKSTENTPLAVEKKLIKYIPTDLIHKAHHWLILYGRYTCTARNPKCYDCGLYDICGEKQKEKYAKKKNF